MDVAVWSLMFLYLGVNSIRDIREKKIYFWLSVGLAAVGSGIQLCVYRISGLNYGMSLSIGFFFWIMTWVTREAVGFGDGLVLLVTGIYLGFQKNMILCVTAILAAGVWALILLIILHKKKSYEMPFVPFLFLGLLAARWMG